MKLHEWADPETAAELNSFVAYATYLREM
jgi:hypothetical protein